VQARGQRSHPAILVGDDGQFLGNVTLMMRELAPGTFPNSQVPPPIPRGIAVSDDEAVLSCVAAWFGALRNGA